MLLSSLSVAMNKSMLNLSSSIRDTTAIQMRLSGRLLCLRRDRRGGTLRERPLGRTAIVIPAILPAALRIASSVSRLGTNSEVQCGTDSRSHSEVIISCGDGAECKWPYRRTDDGECLAIQSTPDTKWALIKLTSEATATDAKSCQSIGELATTT